MNAFRISCAALALLPASSAQPASAPSPERELFPGTGGRHEQPQLAARADGALAVVFVVDGTSVRTAVRPAGKDWQPPRPVAVMADLAVGMRRGPRVAWAGEALVVATIESRWDGKARQSRGSGNLTVRRSVDGGASWSDPVTVNGEDGSAREGLHALAARGGHVAVAWLDPRGEPKGSKVWCALSKDGGVSFAGDFVAYQSPSGAICPCCHPSLCFDERDRVMVMWRDAIDGNRDMFFGTLERDGRPITKPKPAGAGHWRIEACPMDGGGLAVDEAGRAVTVWRREDLVFWSEGDGRERRLGQGKNPVVAVSGRSALVVCERDGRLLASRLSLAAPDARPSIDELGAGSFAAVAAMPGGRFVVLAERRVDARCRLVCYEP